MDIRAGGVDIQAGGGHQRRGWISMPGQTVIVMGPSVVVWLIDKPSVHVSSLLVICFINSTIAEYDH